jgi:hypothetical protein
VTFEEFSPTHDFFDYKGPGCPCDCGVEFIVAEALHLNFDEMFGDPRCQASQLTVCRNCNPLYLSMMIANEYVIARGVFTSLADLQRKLMKYIRHYNNVPKTVKWRYFDPTRRITPSSAVTVH